MGVVGQRHTWPPYSAKDPAAIE